MKRQVSRCNRKSVSVCSGDVESAVELLEGIYTSPNSTNPSMSFIFRKVLATGNNHAVDKCKTHAEIFKITDFN